MPAAIATLLDALTTKLNAPASQSALGQAIAADRGYQETQALAEQTVRLWLSPAGWRSLGRCGGLELAEQLVECRLLRKALPPQANSALDADVLSAEAVRALLNDYDAGSAGRVVDILGPKVIDREKLTSPGQVEIGLLLNCEILTGTAADDPEYSETETPIQRRARRAVWECLNNYPPLAPIVEGAVGSVFGRRYETSAALAELQLRDPAPSELPAIAVYWAPFAPTRTYNTNQEWPMELRLTIWAPGDRHTLLDWLCEQTFDALYRAHAEGSQVPYLHQTLGFPPRRVTEIKIGSAVIGRAQKVRALRADIAITLRSNKDPYGDE